MAYDPQQPQEQKGIFGVIVHSFFVVPFLLAVFSVLLFAAVRILTMEKHSVYDYLRDIKTGGLTKRWQAAFELSRILSNPPSVPQENKFTEAMISAYESSKHDDERVRQYLILAMARAGNQEFTAPLMKDLDQEKDENLYAIITALGILKDNSANDALLKYLQHEQARIRLATVIALGNIGDPQSTEPLKLMLKDAEPNVVWDAAVALAKMGDKSGREVILSLLNRNYLNGFPNIDPRQKSRIMQVAIQSSAGWNDPEIDARLENLFTSDQNMNVRATARQALNQTPQKL